jgi:GT2 family glycosyltransferase
MSPQFLGGRGRVAEEPTHSKKVGIIVLDLDRPELTKRCIEALPCHDWIQVYLIENGHCREQDFETSRPFRFLRIGGNPGYATGMNRGIEMAFYDGCEAFVLMNNDALAQPGAIEGLIATVNGVPNAGLVVPNRAYSVGVMGRRPTAVTTSDEGELRSPDATGLGVLHRVDRITGFCIAIGRSTVKSVGLLDEDFVFGKEDDELAHRVQSKGLILVEREDSVVLHSPSGSTDFSDPRATEFLTFHSVRGRFVLARKMGEPLVTEMPGALRDSFTIWIRAFMTRPGLHLEIFNATIRGLADGVQGPIHQARSIG